MGLANHAALLRDDLHIILHFIEFVKRLVEEVEVLQDADLQVGVDVVEVLLVFVDVWLDLFG